MPSIVESVSKRLNRPDARARLADLAGVTPAAARKAIAPSSRAVIGALARASSQDGGAQPVADLVEAVGTIHADDLIDRLANTCPFGEELVDALFGEERDRVVSVIGGKKAPDSDAGGILLGQLAPVVVAMVAERQSADGLDADALAVMISEEASRSSGAGSAKLGVPARADIVGVTGAVTAARSTMPTAADGVVTEDLPAEAATEEAATEEAATEESGTGATATAAVGGAALAGAGAAGAAVAGDNADGKEQADGADKAGATTVAAAATGVAADAASSRPEPPPRVSAGGDRETVVIDDDGGILRSPLVALTGVVALAVAVAWLLTQVTTETADSATSTSGGSESTEQVAAPTASEDDGDGDDAAPEPEGPTEADGVDRAAEDDAADDDADGAAAGADGAADDADEAATGDDAAEGDDAEGDDAEGDDAEGDDGAADGAEGDADLVSRVAEAVVATGVGDAVAVTAVNGEVTLGGSAPDADAAAAIEDAVAAVDGVVSVTNDIRLLDDGAGDTSDPVESDAVADRATASADGGESATDDDASGEGDKGEGSLNVLLGLDTIGFEYYAEDLSAAGRSELDEVVDYLEANPDIAIEIQGHTDAIGAASLNQRLGQRRADAVRAYLIKAGIDELRLTAVGIGEVDPIASNDTEAGREANRRIEFVIR